MGRIPLFCFLSSSARWCLYSTCCHLVVHTAHEDAWVATSGDSSSTTVSLSESVTRRSSCTRWACRVDDGVGLVGELNTIQQHGEFVLGVEPVVLSEVTALLGVQRACLMALAS